MTATVTRNQRRQLAKENASYPEHLISIPLSEWPASSAHLSCPPLEVWRSRDFLVQIFAEKDDVQRLTICRTRMTGQNWQDGITWDDLQRLKRECGRGNKWAVEIFPAQLEIVNVANMRHLWVLNEAPKFAWRKRKSLDEGPTA